MSGYVQLNSSMNNYSSNSWTVLTDIEIRIKEKIEKVGIPLKDWDIQINYGIKTGFNDAFIIDGEKRKELIEKHPKSEEIIRPILRGKHIRRFGFNTQSEWLIIIPCGWTNKNKGKIDPETFFKMTYPAIFDHLIEKSYLSSKGKGLFGRDDQGNYWWELRPCEYLSEFMKEKILFIDIMTDNENEGYPFPSFSFSGIQTFTLNTSYIITGDSLQLKYILGVLNSRIGRFIVINSVTPLQKRQYRLFQQFVEKFPIPVNENSQNEVVNLVEDILVKSGNGLISKELELKLNRALYKICSLDDYEINFIERN